MMRMSGICGNASRFISFSAMNTRLAATISLANSPAHPQLRVQHIRNRTRFGFAARPRSRSRGEHYPMRPAMRISRRIDRAAIPSARTLAAQIPTSHNARRNINESMIAFAPGDLAAEHVIGPDGVDQDHRYDEHRPDQREGLALRRGRRLPE